MSSRLSYKLPSFFFFRGETYSTLWEQHHCLTFASGRCLVGGIALINTYKHFTLHVTQGGWGFQSFLPPRRVSGGRASNLQAGLCSWVDVRNCLCVTFSELYLEKQLVVRAGNRICWVWPQRSSLNPQNCPFFAHLVGTLRVAYYLAPQVSTLLRSGNKFHFARNPDDC